MQLVKTFISDCFHSATNAWDRFWFTPRDPATLGIIRICTGLMLFYTHLVWAVDWEGFFGTEGWLNKTIRHNPENLIADYQWTHFDWIANPATLWTLHLIALGSMLLLTVGFCSRTAAILSWLFTISYAHRNPFALYGLDAITTMLALYLAISPCGDAFSIDRWLKRRRAGEGSTQQIDASIGANISIRLIQLHMCLIYLFSALGKLQGQTWWDGSAIWYAAGNLEYQSIDTKWLAQWPPVGNLITHTTVFWELSYCVLIWPRLWRPWVLLLAIPLHLGIGLFMGMMTFGLIMLVGNSAFVESWLVRLVLRRKT